MDHRVASARGWVTNKENRWLVTLVLFEVALAVVCLSCFGAGACMYLYVRLSCCAGNCLIFAVDGKLGWDAYLALFFVLSSLAVMIAGFPAGYFENLPLCCL